MTTPRCSGGGGCTDPQGIGDESGNKATGGGERTRHIDTRKHFAHEAIKNGYKVPERTASTSQLADIMSKSVQLFSGMYTKGLFGQPLEPSKTVMAQEGED